MIKVVGAPDPILHFNANPDSVLHMVEHLKFYVQRSANVNCFIFLVSVIGVIIFIIFYSTYIEIFWEKYIVQFSYLLWEHMKIFSLF